MVCCIEYIWNGWGLLLLFKGLLGFLGWLNNFKVLVLGVVVNVK